MTSFSASIAVGSVQPGEPHVHLRVFAGPDADHRAHVGILHLLPQEASDFMVALPADTLAEVTPSVAAHVLYHYGLGGHEPSAFIGQLLATIARADLGNRALLAQGFPGYVAACNLVEAAAAGARDLMDRAAAL